ncbi:hypothetical protein J6590_078045 [Homalodisca vitripennis]|nr:hypothetical protein J6590_078045 [Homalodisca vitripennis]
MGRGIPHDSVRLFCGNPRIIHRAELVLVISGDPPRRSSDDKFDHHQYPQQPIYHADLEDGLEVGHHYSASHDSTFDHDNVDSTASLFHSDHSEYHSHDPEDDSDDSGYNHGFNKFVLRLPNKPSHILTIGNIEIKEVED